MHQNLTQNLKKNKIRCHES